MLGPGSRTRGRDLGAAQMTGETTEKTAGGVRGGNPQARLVAAQRPRALRSTALFAGVVLSPRHKAPGQPNIDDRDHAGQSCMTAVYKHLRRGPQDRRRERLNVTAPRRLSGLKGILRV